VATVNTYQHHFSDDDVVDLTMVFAGSEMRTFAVNYRIRQGDGWKNVLRCDTSHGHVRAHRFWRREGRQVADPRFANEDLAIALRAAWADVEENWRRYRWLAGGGTP
jgi:hypothetical protein